MNLPIIFRSISKIFRFPEFLSLDGSSDIRSGSSDEKFEFALFMPHMPVLRTKNAGWGHLSGGNGSPPPEFESDDDRSYYLENIGVAL